MSEFDAKTFITSLPEGEGAAGVDRAFAALSAKLPEAEYKAAIDAIETYLGNSLRDMIKKEGATELKKNLREEAKTVALSEAQISPQIILHVSETKGEEASPFVKAFVRAAEKLTDEEYNSTQCALKPMLAAIDAVVKEQHAVATPNPFRLKIRPR